VGKWSYFVGDDEIEIGGGGDLGTGEVWGCINVLEV
jgi:hypothetical protein